MASRLLWRRSATAIGTYGSVVAGVAGTLIAGRKLGPHAFGLFAIALVAAGFFQVLLDLTVEEAMIKFGFRYTESERFGRLRRLYRRAAELKFLGALLAAAGLAALAPAADSLFAADGLLVPMLIAAALPLVQAPETLAGAVFVLRGRYDVRAWFQLVGQGLRLAGVAVGASRGVEEALLGLVAGQAVASVAVGLAGLAAFRRFPAATSEGLGDDRREIRRFVVQSSIGSGVVSVRGALAPLLLGLVTSPLQVGLFRAAQAPNTGLAALTAPARLILLTEQTRDWERGAVASVLASLRRYSIGAAALMIVTAPPAYLFMPDLIRLAYGSAFGPASEAARLMLLAGAIQLVFAWTKSLPISIGRPAWRILTHGIETIVLVPLVLTLGAAHGATGAAAGVLASMAVFVTAWAALVVRLHRLPLPAAAAP